MKINTFAISKVGIVVSLIIVQDVKVIVIHYETRELTISQPAGGNTLYLSLEQWMHAFYTLNHSRFASPRVYMLLQPVQFDLSKKKSLVLQTTKITFC